MYKFKQKDAGGREIFLASASPRRREILADMGLTFTVCPADCDESVPEGTHPRDAVKILARRKARAAEATVGCGGIIVAADTLVALGDVALGKPADTDEAYEMIRALSGKTHHVYTGVAVLMGDKILVRSDATAVVFRPYGDDEARAYADTKEGLDKAGAYGIQGLGGALVDRIEGEYDNVVGFPARLADKMLCELVGKTVSRRRAYTPPTDEIIATLKALYPDAECALRYAGDPWRLLVMGRLSAQCTDARVNIVCEELFRIFPTAEAMAAGDIEKIEEIVRPCGLYKHKAREIRAASEMLIRDFGGTLPDNMDDLLKFPGVGRKIANLLLGDIFGKSAVVTDTHCIRICGRLGYYPEDEKNPLRVERVLIKREDDSEEEE